MFTYIIQTVCILYNVRLFRTLCPGYLLAGGGGESKFHGARPVVSETDGRAGRGAKESAAGGEPVVARVYPYDATSDGSSIWPYVMMVL